MSSDALWQSYGLAGRTVVLTGGTGVLGSEMACALVRAGANAVVVAREPSRAGPLKERLAQGPGAGMLIQGDILSQAALRNTADEIQQRCGAVYALVNAAGGNAPQATTGVAQRFFDLPQESLRQVADLNLLGTIIPCQVFGRMMAENGAGTIVNIASMAGMRPLTRVVAYSAAKAAVANFTQWLAVHMAQEYAAAIRVNAIAPGFFHTRQNHYLLYDEKGGDLTPRGRTIIDHTPAGRFGKPEDLLGALFWLLSESASFVTGTVVAVDGGFSAFSGV